jgi:predicted glycoside hydrolase/deacetylase ChbG (UPF0249 family)
MYTRPFRITIDDLGMFPEVETGILSLKEFQIPLYCSWVTNYCPPSAAIRQSPFHNGLHFNIIEGPSHTKSSALADSEGNFRRKWFDFLFADQKTKAAVAEELKLQLEKALGWFGKLSHLDSHLHLHSIPWIHALLLQAQKHYGIPYLRNPSQPIFHSSTPWQNPAQIVKLGILNSLSRASDMKDPPCFGLTELFQMKSQYCLDHLPLLPQREVVWHAADLPNKIDSQKFRFVSEPQLTLRKNELTELREFLKKLSSNR